MEDDASSSRAGCELLSRNPARFFSIGSEKDRGNQMKSERGGLRLGAGRKPSTATGLLKSLPRDEAESLIEQVTAEITRSVRACEIRAVVLQEILAEIKKSMQGRIEKARMADDCGS
jgi:hypothetical protein